MSLASLLTEVYSITNRSDLVAQTTQAVKMATLKAHMSDFYPRDLIEVNQATASTATFFSLPTSTFTRFRALNYVQKSELVRVETTPYDFLAMLSADDLVDDYKGYKVNVVYLAGTNLNFRVSEAVAALKIGYYSFPNITDAGFSSWIDDTQPYAIICEAARTMFKTLGYDEESRTYDALVGEQIGMLKMTNINVRAY